MRFLQSLVSQAYKQGIESKAGVIKCYKEKTTSCLMSGVTFQFKHVKTRYYSIWKGLSLSDRVSKKERKKNISQTIGILFVNKDTSVFVNRGNVLPNMIPCTSIVMLLLFNWTSTWLKGNQGYLNLKMSRSWKPSNCNMLSPSACIIINTLYIIG